MTSALERTDIDGDRFVSPIDALKVINFLNSVGPINLVSYAMNQLMQSPDVSQLTKNGGGWTLIATDL